ncbi:MAG: putative Ig domain-containing protein, partial [Crocosphaera sp.]|uniref:CARDB domain-containing protein n=1 Tax=Crocosphaera sp. TaxID=2729996 RepID=UPI00258E517B
LDLRSDRYLGSVEHRDGLSAGESYSVNQTLNLPNNLTGPYYVFVMTDAPQSRGIGEVFEGSNEGNNATPSIQPLIIEFPPPSDLQVDTITLPSRVETGETIELEWTIFNRGDYKAEGEWTDAVYLSTDATWDINDIPIGRVSHQGTLNPGESYTSQLETNLPPAIGAQYRVIVRPDIYNQVFEGPHEANNRTASAEPITVTVAELQLGVPLTTSISKGEDKLYQVDVGLNQTLKVDLNASDPNSSNEIFLRYGDAPTGIVYDAAYEGQLAPNQSAVIPTTKPGVYYVLVRGQGTNTPITLFADILPFEITDVQTDRGGDSSYVTTTIHGAQFQEDAIVKLVRPGFAEYQPVNYEVIDSTEIRAIFDLEDAPHGLYDIKVVNPDGETAIVPYRYLVERTIEPDVDIALGGPRVLQIGETGTYGVSVNSLTNIDTPYIHFQFGVPELGKNGVVYGFEHLTFSSNLRGQPENDQLNDLPWASLISDTNTNGSNLAPGYIFDLPTGQFTGQTFNVQVYPGIAGIREQDFVELRRAIYAAYPELEGQLTNSEDLATVYPSVWEDFQSGDLEALEYVDPFDVAFQFPIVATATALTREEFIQQQEAEARRLRNAILVDAEASQGLILLAADEEVWVQSYLGALEISGLLRPEEQAPPVRENPLVVSLMATLGTGILAGTAGEQIVTEGNLVSFFEKIREWYGHDENLIGTETLPNFEDYDLGLSNSTDFEAFNIYVPFANELGSARLDLPPSVPVEPVNFTRFFNATDGEVELGTLNGPLAFGNEGFIPVGQKLPYTINFENAATASANVGEIRIVSELDPDLDVRSFELGSLQLGDIQVHIPQGRGNFEGTFDFIESKGFQLRVSAGVDIFSNTATWLLQAIDPDTGEVVQDTNLGILAPNDAQGSGAGFVTYTVKPKLDEEVTTGAEISSQARILFNTAAPIDTETITYTLDAQAPTTNLTVTRLNEESSDYLIEWQAIDDDNGSGVKHVTVYVATNGGDFKIWQRQTQDSSGIYQGEAGQTYEFIAIATDNAGNKEQPQFTLNLPDDGSGVNLGTLPSIERTTPDLADPPQPSSQTATNPLFTEAEAAIPSPDPLSNPSEFDQVLRPFTAQSFATGIPESHGEIGPMAIALRPDGSILASGGTGRNQLYVIPPQGENQAPVLLLQTLSHPIFDLAYDETENLWATTGGGPLLQLDANTGEILQEYGDGITQSLAIHPDTGLIYVSSGNGIEIFDPSTASFSHYSDIRVGNLAFAPDGQLWATTWPERGEVIRFDAQGNGQRMLTLETPVDSIAFGMNHTQLEGLLFVSSNNGELTMVDIGTLRTVKLAEGGSRGDIVETTPDGRVLLSQSQQIDVISPIVAPQVITTNPVANSHVTLPNSTILVTFDQDMFVGTATNSSSVVNPSNFKLTGTTLGTITPETVQYDVQTRTVQLTFEALLPDSYELRVEDTVRSLRDIGLDDDYTAQFTAISDFLGAVDFQFNTPRSERGQETISYEVSLTNKVDYDLRLPLVLFLDPAQNFTGIPLNHQSKTEQGYAIDLSESLPDGTLSPDESITGKVITLHNPDQLKVSLTPGLYALPTVNQAPSFTSTPVGEIKAGDSYQYQAIAVDPDGVALAYLLYDAPEGMTIDSNTGLVTWTPTRDNDAQTPVTLRVYDSRGGYGVQRFTIEVDGGNHQPVFSPLPGEIEGREGELLEIPLLATDADDDSLTYWVNNLPGGAIFDPVDQMLRWIPGFEAA